MYRVLALQSLSIDHLSRDLWIVWQSAEFILVSTGQSICVFCKIICLISPWVGPKSLLFYCLFLGSSCLNPLFDLKLRSELLIQGHNEAGEIVMIKVFCCFYLIQLRPFLILVLLIGWSQCWLDKITISFYGLWCLHVLPTHVWYLLHYQKSNRFSLDFSSLHNYCSPYSQSWGSKLNCLPAFRSQFI